MCQKIDNYSLYYNSNSHSSDTLYIVRVKVKGTWRYISGNGETFFRAAYLRQYAYHYTREDVARILHDSHYRDNMIDVRVLLTV